MEEKKSNPAVSGLSKTYKTCPKCGRTTILGTTVTIFENAEKKG
jgi:hypothetical protein